MAWMDRKTQAALKMPVRVKQDREFEPLPLRLSDTKAFIYGEPTHGLSHIQAFRISMSRTSQPVQSGKAVGFANFYDEARCASLGVREPVVS